MDLLEQPPREEANVAAAAGDDDHALLGLPPGVSVPFVTDTAPSPVPAAAGGGGGGGAAAARQIQWYHLDPDEHYEELRTGVGPGLWRGLAFGGLLSVLAVGLFYFCMWMIEPSAALLNPFMDRSYAEAREELVAHLGGLSPIALKTSATTQPGAAAGAAPAFDISDLRAAHQPSAGGGGAGYTWYRFDLPREQVPAYRKHLATTWLAPLKHRVDNGPGDTVFKGDGAPPWWEAGEFERELNLRLIRTNGDVAFHAAFSAARGRVYIRVKH